MSDFYAHPTLVFGSQEIIGLKEKAKSSYRQRAAEPIHKDHQDPIQRVFMSANCGTYVAPHLHPDKEWELIILLEGAIDILLFSEEGCLDQRISLQKNKNIVCEYRANKFHGAIIRRQNTVVMEFKNGPYVPENAKLYPKWAPSENSADAAHFNEGLKQLKLGESVGGLLRQDK